MTNEYEPGDEPDELEPETPEPGGVSSESLLNAPLSNWTDPSLASDPTVPMPPSSLEPPPPAPSASFEPPPLPATPSALEPPTFPMPPGHTPPGHTPTAPPAASHTPGPMFSPRQPPPPDPGATSSAQPQFQPPPPPGVAPSQGPADAFRAPGLPAAPPVGPPTLAAPSGRSPIPPPPGSNLTGQQTTKSKMPLIIGAAIGAIVLAGIAALVFARSSDDGSATESVEVFPAVATSTPAPALSGGEPDGPTPAPTVAPAFDPTRPQSFVATRAEERCYENQGITLKDTLSAFTDTSVEGGDTQIRILDALLICAPRIVNDPIWIEDFRSSFSAGLGAQVSTEEIQCMINDAIANSTSPGLVLAGEDPDQLLASIEACFSQEVLDFVLGAPGTGPQVYGDDPTYDLLYDRCLEGNDNACDLLYTLSSLDSEYFILSEDCAGRGLQSLLFCTEGLNDNDGSGFADEDSPGFAAIERDCIAGDMIACDMALTVTEVGSATGRVGETCGNRIAISVDTCVAQYGEQASE